MQDATKDLQRSLERHPRSSKGLPKGSNRALRRRKTSSKKPPRHLFLRIKVGSRRSIHSVNCNTIFRQQTVTQKAPDSKTAPKSSCAVAKKCPSTTEDFIADNNSSQTSNSAGTRKVPLRWHWALDTSQETLDFGRQSKTLVPNNGSQKLLLGF